MRLNEVILNEAPLWPKTKDEILRRLKSDYINAHGIEINDDLTVNAELFRLNSIHTDVEHKYPKTSGPGRKPYYTKVTPYSGKYLPVKLKNVETFEIKTASNLITLEGMPEVVGDFSISFALKLTTLDFLPKEIEGEIHVTNCKKLTSLGKFPAKAHNDVTIARCPSLNSLIGLPSHVHRDVIIRLVPTISKNGGNFEGLPSYIGGDLYIDGNGITSLVGLHEHVKHLSGSLEVEWEDIKEGGIGLILIDGFINPKQISYEKFTQEQLEMPPYKALSIIM